MEHFQTKNRVEVIPKEFTLKSSQIKYSDSKRKSLSTRLMIQKAC